MKTPMLKTMHSHVSDGWATPVTLYQDLHAEFDFDFDPCPLNGTADGTSELFVSWRGKRVFCNPPYGRGIPKFLDRAGEAEIAVFLLPARVDTKWFHELVLPKAKEIRFIKGRLAFGGVRNHAPFPNMIVIFQNCQHAHKSKTWDGYICQDCGKEWQPSG